MPFSANIFSALKRRKEPEAQAVETVEEPAQTAEAEIQAAEKCDEIEKAIFQSATGFGDNWAEEAEGEDWGAPAPVELESDHGWTTKTAKVRVPKGKKGQHRNKQRQKVVRQKQEVEEEEVVVEQPSMHQLLADVEDELGIELAKTDDEEDDSSEEEEEQEVSEVVVQQQEQKPAQKENLSKKERQELKKKELEDLDAMLAELGVDTKSSSDTAQQKESSKAAKRKAKKERKAANGTHKSDEDEAHQQEPAESVTGPAIDPDAVKAAKTALKKKAAPKKGMSAAQAAAKAVASKKKKGGPKDPSKFNEFSR